MTEPTARYLTDGRLHLQHGPIDLLIGANGPAARAAFDAAENRFQTALRGLVDELPLLWREISETRPTGPIGQRMHEAVLRHQDAGFVTPMAAVAGSVADEVLTAMKGAGPLGRAYVNNGGDIALHLSGQAGFSIAMRGDDNADHGVIRLTARDGVGGIATSGRGGRSLSMGIADSVTVLARDAASADVAATLIANAVDLPGHPRIGRVPASDCDPESDLGDRLVVTLVGHLSGEEIASALARGLHCAEGMRSRGLIIAAALNLSDNRETTGLPAESGMLNHA